MNARKPVRIVLLGKTGSGKSSLANTIFGEKVFEICHFPVSETGRSRAETKLLDGRLLTLIESCGVFGTQRSEAEPKKEILRCITQCAPGPHAFLIVLKVEKFTEQEEDVVRTICQSFSEDALKFAAVVFTHGDQLRNGMRMEEFVGLNESLSDLVRRCGGRCHVVDNKYWKTGGEDPYRSNQVQVKELLKTVDEMTQANGGRCYTNEMLQVVNRNLQIEEENIRQSAANMSQEEIRNMAKGNIIDELLVKLVATATGAVLGAFLGVTTLVILQESSGASARRTSDSFLNVVLSEGIKGGVKGFHAGEGAKTPADAFQKAKSAVLSSSVMLSAGLGGGEVRNNSQRTGSPPTND